MSAILPLSGDKQTSGVRSKNDAHDPKPTSAGSKSCKAAGSCGLQN